MSDFNVKFRGVRGSFPVADKNFLKFGGNTSCVEVNAGGRLIILDAGTGIVSLGNEMTQKHIASSVNPKDRTPCSALILLSHIHIDHLLGLAFFNPLHIKSSKIKLYGSGSHDSSIEQALKELVFGKGHPLDLEVVACQFDINELVEGCGILIKPEKEPELVRLDNVIPNENDILITFYQSYTHPNDAVMIYRISYKGKSLVYATDKECCLGGDNKFCSFAKDCDLLIHDAQYITEDYFSLYNPKQGFGHSTYDMAIEAMKQSRAQNIIFYHYDPNYDDTKLSMIEERYALNAKNIQMAYEGLEFEIF